MSPAPAQPETPRSTVDPATGRSTPQKRTVQEQRVQDVSRRAQLLASRGDVRALLALRADTDKRYRQLGKTTDGSLAALLDELDTKIDEARAVRLRLDAKAFRRQ